MKTLKLLFSTLLLTAFTTSCHVEIIDDPYVEEPSISLNQLLMSYDLWYIDINKTSGNGEVPFLQTAFTVSFDYGVMLANNNLVGIGKTGNGLGIDIANYSTYGVHLEVDHDADGLWKLEVKQVSDNVIRLYHRPTNTSYHLTGYLQRYFDYDAVFYDNIHYFLQEYKVWEKTYTSEYGAINEFDDENYLQFFSDNVDDIFRSSIDGVGKNPNNIQWDYKGIYTVYDVPGDNTLKTLTLDYDFLGNDYFELYVINDETIELYHPDSETVYRFKGRGYIEYLKSGKGEATKVKKKRKKTENPTMNITRKRVTS
jgi:hypothetical protein